jgi:hypothetical protein
VYFLGISASRTERLFHTFRERFKSVKPV